MKVTRRRFLSGAAAAPLLAAGAAAAGPGAPESDQNAGWSRFSLGDLEITVVSDGNLVVPATGLGVNAPSEEVAAFLESRYLDAEMNYAHTNHVLIDTGAARILVDVGSGDKFQPSAGKLLENLDAAGVAPEDVTHVALTHAHPDHVWGAMDDFGDEPRFPEASHAIGAAEFDWWTAENRENEVPETMQAFVVGAKNALTPLADRLVMLKDGDEVAPGVRMIATPGHTIGHMSVLVESAGEALLIAGDAVSHADVSFERPEWHGGFDMDPDQAAQTRKRLLDMAATDRIALSGYHLPFPGVGYAARHGDAYRYVPAPWRWRA